MHAGARQCFRPIAIAYRAIELLALFIAFICRHSCATVRTSGFEKTDSGARSTKSYDFPAFRFGGLALSGKAS
jgi:hypothetical protein